MQPPTPPRPLVAIWTTALRHLWRQRWPLLQLNLIYTGLGFVLLSPLTGVVVHFLFGFSGKSALANQSILYFLLTPSGIVAVTLSLGIIIAVAVLKQASLIFFYTQAKSRQHSTIAPLLFAARNSNVIFRFSLRLLGRIAVLSAPYLVVSLAIVWLFLRHYDINYYLTQQPPVFWFACGMLALIILAMSVAVIRRALNWSLALPLLLLARLAPARAFQVSEELTQGKQRFILGVLTIWAALNFALGSLVFFVVQQIGTLLIPHTYRPLILLVIVLGGLMVLWTFLNIMTTWLSESTLAFALVELGRQLDAPFIEPNTPQEQPFLTASSRNTLARSTVALLILLASAAVGVWLVESTKIRNDILIIAHRGAASKAPENTLAAAQQAIIDKADWLEIDVQETADGEVVVVHDSDFMKLANKDLKVWQGTLEQIQDIDVGSWFGSEFADQRVPTLSDILAISQGKAKVLIELKHYGHNQQLEDRVVAIVEAMGMVDEVAIMSLDYASIRKIRELRPDWKIGLLATTAVGNLTRLDSDFLAVNTRMATSRFLKQAAAAGKPIWVWTVNDPITLFRIMSLGVDAVITDEPEIARNVLAIRAELNPIEHLLIDIALLFDLPLAQGTYRDNSP